MFRYYGNLLDWIATYLILLTEVQQLYHEEILYLDTDTLKEQPSGYLQYEHGDGSNNKRNKRFCLILQK